MVIILKKVFTGVSEFGPAFLFSSPLCYASGLQNLSYKSSSYIVENSREHVNTASQLVNASSSWLSIFSWTCLALIVILAVFLILWSLASLSASLIPVLSGRKGPAGGRHAANRISIGDIGKSTRLSAIDSVNRTRLAETFLTVPTRNRGHAA